jgi:hypothetical protein
VFFLQKLTFLPLTQFEKIFVVGLPERTDRRDGFVLSAALSNMDIELVDGVHGEAVPNKAIPAVGQHDRMPDPVIGCWRGHMNAIQEYVSPRIPKSSFTYLMSYHIE